MTESQSKKNIFQKIRDLDRTKKSVLGAGVAVLLYTVIGFLVLPPVVKMTLEKKLPEALHRDVSIGKIRMNPYTLTATIEDFSLQRMDRTKPFVGFDRLFVNLQTASLFKRALIIKSVDFTGPVVSLTRNQDQTFNFSDLIGEKEKKESLEKEAKPFLFSINNITVVNGNIEFQDLYKETTHRVAELNLAVPSVSNLPYDIEKNVQPAFSAIINDAPFALDGKTKPFTSSRETGIAIKFDKINIPEYLAYIPNPTGLTLASGTLDVDVRVSYRHQKKDNRKLAVTGLVAVNDINLTDHQGVSYVRLPRLTVSLADSNLLEKEVRISGIRIDNPECEFERLSTGDILPLSLLTTGSDIGEEGAQDEKEESKEAPVALTIDEIHINSGRVKFKDSATPPFTIDLRPIDVKVVNFSTLPEKEAQFDISITTEADESLAVKGAFGINPLSASLGLDVKNIELKKLQPYVAEQVNIVLTDGAVSVQGDVTLQKRDDEEISLQFAGKSALSDLATVDTVLGEDLLRWKNLNLSGISFSSAPQALAIKDISFQDIYAKLIVAENGTLNLATLKRGGPEEETPQEGKDAEKKTASRIEIGRVAISGGTIDFLDRKIKPEFAASLTDLEGTVSALSSKEETLADVSISGTLNRQAPLKIIGKVNPLKEELYTDLTIEFYDIGLSPMSPYTGKYIGYKTEKGKLTLDLSYNIDNRDLKAKNNIFLDQFTLGAAVDSPDAANLPIHLALALLKNRKGEITLNVPVSGNLDDPEFSIAGIVFKVIFNLIAKAVTSPFALLGALIPEGEELQYVGFEPGLGGLDDDSQKKLEKMAEVLFERPGLRMDIIGRVDPGKDREAIETRRFEKLLTLEKMKEMTKKQQEEELSPESVVISKEEYPQYLALAHETLQLKKAVERGENITGKKMGALFKKMFTKKEKLSEEEAARKELEKQQAMEAELRAEVAVSDGDLRLLAIQRANKVMSFLVENGPVESERLFVIEPEVAAGADSKENAMQVEMVIK